MSVNFKVIPLQRNLIGCLVVLALLWVQFVGQVHRIEHFQELRSNLSQQEFHQTVSAKASSPLFPISHQCEVWDHACFNHVLENTFFSFDLLRLHFAQVFVIAPIQRSSEFFKNYLSRAPPTF